MRLLIAQAGGSAPAQLLTNAFTGLAAKTGRRLHVVDVACPRSRTTPSPSPRSSPSSACSFPAWPPARRRRTLPPPPDRVAHCRARRGGGGDRPDRSAIAAGVTGFGDYLAVAGIVALFSLAISARTAALGRIKLPLIALAVITFLIVGVPVSSGQFQPGPVRTRVPAGAELRAAAGRGRRRGAPTPVCFHRRWTPPDTCGSSAPGPRRASARSSLHSTRPWLSPALSHYGLRMPTVRPTSVEVMVPVRAHRAHGEAWMLVKARPIFLASSVVS